MRSNLLSWQYQGYPEFHRDRTNLLIHIVAVPAFIVSFAGFALGVVALHWVQMAAALLGMAGSFLVQGVGHRREVAPPIPFAGPGDAVSRIMAEQFVTFPRFVFAGGFSRALRAAFSR